MNIAYYTSDKNWLKNRMFDPNSINNINNVFYRYTALRNFLVGKGINLNTHDIYQNLQGIDLWIMAEPFPSLFKFILQNRINPRKVILFLIEPPVVNNFGWKFLPYYSWMFKVILTWNPDLVEKGRRFTRYYFPMKFDESKYPYYKSKEKRNLCLMIHSNKISNVSGELYSLRRKIIKYYENRGDNLLNLYGYGWNDSKSPNPFSTNLYKGTVPDKYETFSGHSFVFCIDNCIVPGYLTYDPFIAMATASVPVYIPMPDSDEYIPKNTYVNYNDFKNFDELTSYLQSVVNTKEYEEYRRKGWEYLNSEKYRPFTVQNFCEDVYRAIQLAIK